MYTCYCSSYSWLPVFLYVGLKDINKIKNDLKKKKYPALGLPSETWLTSFGVLALWPIYETALLIDAATNKEASILIGIDLNGKVMHSLALSNLSLHQSQVLCCRNLIYVLCLCLQTSVSSVISQLLVFCLLALLCLIDHVSNPPK